MKYDELQKRLREKLETAGISVPAEFPCPQPQRVTRIREINRYIDHTLLKQTAGSDDYQQLYSQALDWKPFSVCIPPLRVPRAVEVLKDSPVATCTVVGFPWGYDSSEAKAADARWAVSRGCDEIDMVISVGQLKDGEYARVFRDIKTVVDAVGGKLVKVILESSELDEKEIASACFISGWAGAWFVKTSTGFASSGASIEAVKIMREVAGDVLGVKASGGIRSADFAAELISAGADRIGASATGTIIGAESSVPSGY